ncbi:hypothetical protein HD806DRAFT_530860 [Xylariaceae sp. AK1471]|nr:hypothetical protein HD806DRAFT_530860 [Xylariaceae sp. AK1471]
MLYVPPDSTFAKDYQNYKDLEERGEATEDAYKKYLEKVPKASKKVRDRNPGVYDGEPKATLDWHRTAAEKAEDARDGCRGSSPDEQRLHRL